MPDRPDKEYEILKPVVTGWLSKIQLGIKAKASWQDVADQCMQFYSGVAFWEDKIRRRYVGGKIKPKFHFVIAKAFELVAIFGPFLYHQNPTRTCKPYRRMEYTPEMIAESLGIDSAAFKELAELAQQAEQAFQADQPLSPEMEQAYLAYQQMQRQIQQVMQQETGERTRLEVAAKLVEQYLSYTPREQPNGGLEQAAEDAITELLVKGRGLLFPRPYTMPGSDRVLTGCFWESADRLVTDPDAESIQFGDTKWIALQHDQPTWEVERHFNLPPGSLKGKGTMESSERQAQQQGPIARQNPHRNRLGGKTNDLITWWEVWSLTGVGTRMAGVSKELNQGFDQAVGDAAYICVAKGVPWPLNAHIDAVRAADDEEILDMFSWPIPYHLDQRWPCAFLETYREPGSSWPIAPMKPGLGELVFLNVAMSILAGRMWHNSKLITAVKESAKKYVEDALNSGDELVVIGIKEVHDDINKMISEFQHRDISFDVYKIIDQVFTLFDRRVGLSEVLYGANVGGVASRTATDAKGKEQKASIRPRYMRKKVDSWMGELARMEKLCAYWAGVSGESVRPLMGETGARLWDRLIVEADPEMILHEMDATTESGSTRRPDKERDQDNINQVFPALAPILDNHADLTTDTQPLNELIQAFGDSLSFDMSDIKMGPRVPPPPPPGTPDPEQQEMQMELFAKQTEMVADEQDHKQEMRQDSEEHKQKIRHREIEHKQDVQMKKTQNRLARLGANGRGSRATV